MKRLSHLPVPFRKNLAERRVLKVISGLNNFEAASVKKISKAAAFGGADFLDVACDPDLVRLAIKTSDLPVCVSAVDPFLFPKAVEAGAAMIEIGNFDSFYEKGRFFYAEEVLGLTKESRKLLPDTPLSVTVPHVLPLDQQEHLALELVDAGADLIQTEGGKSARPLSSGVHGLIEKASPTLAATVSIVNALKKANKVVPVISASGLSAITLPLAVACGSSGGGVGSAINRLDDDLLMVAEVKRLRASLDQVQQPIPFF